MQQRSPPGTGGDMKTKVVFRKWKRGDVIAFFPELPGTSSPETLSSYMHVGQHGVAHQGVMRQPYTFSASPEEYEGLKKELENKGYELEILKRSPPGSYQKRGAAIREGRK